MRRRIALRGFAAACALALAWCAGATAHVYWANQNGGSIGRATAAGTQVDQRFITGATAPRAVAVDGRHVYWADGGGGGSIGRARLDGTGARVGFVATGGVPRGVAVDNAGVYWTHVLSGSGHVGRAALDGTRATGTFVPTGPSPCGIAVEPDGVYWANGGPRASIGHSHGRFDVFQGLVTGLREPCGVAVAGDRVYWADRAANAIGRARLDGTAVQRRYISTPAPCGVAVTASHVYWTNAARGTIARASRRDRRIRATLIRGARQPCGIAVDPTIRAIPRAHRFARTAVGRRSAIEPFRLVNTASSPLEVRRIAIVGRHRRDFAMTGDSCTVNVVPAGGECIFNFVFAPTASGLRQARLRVTSNASNSPVSIRLAGRGRG